MGMWDWLFGGDVAPTTVDINPATGLPLLSDIGGVDVGGNPYGTDWQKTDFSSPVAHFNNGCDMGPGFGNDWSD